MRPGGSDGDPVEILGPNVALHGVFPQDPPSPPILAVGGTTRGGTCVVCERTDEGDAT